MSNDVERWEGNCRRCLAHKTLPKRGAPLHSINITQPMELVCIDFLGLEMDKIGFKSILMVTDHFTRCSGVPNPKLDSRNRCKSPVGEILCKLRPPIKVAYRPRTRVRGQSQGAEKLLSIRKSRTTPYQPQGDPQSERFNRTVLNMLGTLKKEDKLDWR